LLENSGQGPWRAIAASPVFRVVFNEQQQVIANARLDIERLIASNEELGPKFLRLSFHDCVGGCDGCVDLTNEDNGGLLEPIRALRPIVAQHAGPGRLLSRADIWALAGLTGADVAQERQRVDMRMHHFGRVNCEVANNICFNADGFQQPCSDVRGPHRHLPPADITTHDLFAFFNENFGYNDKETVAIMGAHTIGQLKRENSGFDGESGWLLNNDIFDSEYYKELVGGSSPNDPMEVLVDGAPAWQPDREDNSDLPEFPDKFVWTGFPEGTKIIMLNADIAIVREITDRNMRPDGTVTCNFVGAGRCPVAERSFRFAVEYTFDNLLWLNDFYRVFEIMITSGYRGRENCSLGRVCRLTPL